MNSIPHSRARSRGFTLIELLTVIAIIGILAAIIIPVVGKVRASARASTSASNLRQIGMAATLYTEDNRGVIAPLRKVVNGSTKIWMQLLMPFSNPGQPDSIIFTDSIRSTVYRDPAVEGPINNDFYSQGYAMNWKPLWPENTRFNDETISGWMVRPAIGTITHSTRRLLAVEGDLWLIDEQTANADKIALGRHGNAVRVVFFDGHVEAMTDRATIHRRVTDPGAP